MKQITLEAILDHVPTAIYIKDPDGKYVYVNRIYEDLLDINRKEIYGHRDVDILPGRIATLSRSYDMQVLGEEKRMEFQEELHLGDGLHTYHSVKFPLYDHNALLFGMCSVSFDMTELRSTTEALHDSDLKFRAIFDNTNQFIGLLDPSGILLEANRTSLSFIKQSLSEVIGKPFWDTPWWSSSAKDRQNLKDAIHKASNGEKVHFEVTHINPEGHPVIIDFSLNPIKDASGRVIWLVPEGHDITELRRAQQEKRMSDDRYRVLFEKSADPVLILEDDCIQDCNQALLKLLGYKQTDALIGKTPVVLAPQLQPDDKPSETAFSELIEAAYTRGYARREITLKHTDGSIVPVDVSCTAIPDPTQRIVYMSLRDITEQKRQEAEIRGLNNELHRLVEVKTEELTQKLELLDETKAQMVLAEKLATLGSLIPGFSHEINTPVGVSITTASFLNQSLQRLQRKFNKGELTNSEFNKFIGDAMEASKAMLSNLDQAAKMVYSIKDISTDQVSDAKRMFNVRKYLDEIILSLHSELKRSACTIDIQCPDALNVSSYPGVFSQIFNNLIMNSLHHGFDKAEEGRISIQVDIKGSTLMIAYEDNGKGMDETTRLQVFDPFFTTRRKAGNTGLGMHIVHDLVTETLGGTIRLESAPGQGVRFYLEVPLRG